MCSSQHRRRHRRQRGCVGVVDFVSFFAIFIASLRFEIASAVVRCYCNDAQCISTGYICKSNIGVCYTASASAAYGDDVTDHRRWSSAPRGCVDLLPTPPGGNDAVMWSCRGATPDDVTRPSWSLSAAPDAMKSRPSVAELDCCQHDLCNYADHGGRSAGSSSSRNDAGQGGAVVKNYDGSSHSIDASSQLLDDVVDGPSFRQHAPPPPPIPPVVVDSSSSSTSTTEIWFRTAVIVVPLTGLVLLGVLVIIAARMLHNDAATKRRRQPELPTFGFVSPVSALDLWRHQHDHRQPFRSACRCSDVISGVGGGSGDRAGANRYEKMSSSESVVVVGRGLTSGAFVSDHVIDDGLTSSGRLLNYCVGADDVVCTLSDDPNASLVRQ